MVISSREFQSDIPAFPKFVLINSKIQQIGMTDKYLTPYCYPTVIAAPTTNTRTYSEATEPDRIRFV